MKLAAMDNFDYSEHLARDENDMERMLSRVDDLHRKLDEYTALLESHHMRIHSMSGEIYNRYGMPRLTASDLTIKESKRDALEQTAIPKTLKAIEDTRLQLMRRESNLESELTHMKEWLKYLAEDYKQLEAKLANAQRHKQSMRGHPELEKSADSEIRSIENGMRKIQDVLILQVHGMISKIEVGLAKIRALPPQQAHGMNPDIVALNTDEILDLTHLMSSAFFGGGRNGPGPPPVNRRLDFGNL